MPTENAITSFNHKTFAIKSFILPAIAAICIIVLLIHGRIPQEVSYHDFADKRNLFGIPNFMNVISNLPFALVALLGIAVAKNIRDTEARHIHFTLFTGFFLLTFGSGYYHLWPTNETLVYDRLCMVIIFMSFFAFIIYERINQASGYIAFLCLIVQVSSPLFTGS